MFDNEILQNIRIINKTMTWCFDYDMSMLPFVFDNGVMQSLKCHILKVLSLFQQIFPIKIQPSLYPP